MISDPDQIGGLVQDAPQQPSGAGNGAQPAARSGVQGLPPLPRGARNRALLLIGDRQLSPQQLAMVAVTARLMVHLERASARLLRDGEVTREGEPKVLLRTVQDLARQIKGNLADIFGAEASDPIADVVRGSR